jgi:hypothetical protein
MLGKKGAPSLFKFGFKVVPREEAEGACIRACAARDCGLLELELGPLGPTGRVGKEGGRLVVLGNKCALCGIGDRCCFEAQPVHSTMLAQPVHSTSIHPCAKPLALPC